MDWSIIADNLGYYLQGATVTIKLLCISVTCGLLLALTLAPLRNSPNRWVRLPVQTYTYFFRGTPMLIQLLMVYYGLGQFAWMQQQWREGHILWLLFRDPYFCALFTFTLNTAAYSIEIFAGSLRTIPRGEIEAALASGLSRWQVYSRLLLPQAWRRALPAYANEVVFMLQGSAVASVVTLVDITGAARDINSRYFAPFEAFITAALCYILLTYFIAWGFRYCERKWLLPWQKQGGN